jgi:hypothetical protein
MRHLLTGPQYNYAPCQLVLFATKARGSMLQPGMHQSISIANIALFVCTITINFHDHSWDTLRNKKYSHVTEALIPQECSQEALDWSSR